MARTGHPAWHPDRPREPKPSVSPWLPSKAIIEDCNPTQANAAAHPTHFLGEGGGLPRA